MLADRMRVSEGDSLTEAVIMAGNGMRRSTDGGETWEDIAPSSALFQDVATSPVNPSHVVVVASGEVWYSLDGGTTWNESLFPSPWLSNSDYHKILYTPWQVYLLYTNRFAAARIGVINTDNMSSITIYTESEWEAEMGSSLLPNGTTAAVHVPELLTLFDRIGHVVTLNPNEYHLLFDVNVSAGTLEFSLLPIDAFTLRNILWSEELQMLIVFPQSSRPWYSYNGTDWFEGDATNLNSTSKYGVAWAEGFGHGLYTNRSNELLRSTNGQDWNQIVNPGSSSILQGLEWLPENKVYVTVDDGSTAFVSPNGTSWTSYSMGASIDAKASTVTRTLIT